MSGADRQRQQREHRQLAEQDQRDLAARESQHAQARQLALPLGQRDARRVVDHAERDDAGEHHVEKDLQVHVLRHRLAEILERDRRQGDAGDGRQRLHGACRNGQSRPGRA